MGKGEINWEISTKCFQTLKKYGIDTHFVEPPEPRYMVVKRANMIKIESVARRIIYGSLLKRLPFEKGRKLDFIMHKFFYKEDAFHDPLVNDDRLVALGITQRHELKRMRKVTRDVFIVLEKELYKHGITLVDLKIEFGRVNDKLIVADEITNDSWRIWKGGKEEQMIDKEIYRRGKDLERVKMGYEEALEIVRKF